MAFINFPSESVPIFQTYFHAALQKPVLQRKHYQFFTKAVRENECSIIYAPLTKFMMPLGGHAVVLCLLLLAVVHCCILMDMSNNEVSFWQCSKELVSLPQ